MDVIEANANGSTFQEISKKNFRLIPVVVPPSQVLKQFATFVHPVHGRMVTNLRASSTLSTLRDTLLPRLISGELRVKGAERFLQEVQL